MAYAEKLVKSWRACWKGPTGKVEKESGFATKKDARKYAEEQEALARRGATPASAHTTTLHEWAESWYSSLDLEPATMRGYKSVLNNHIIRTWGTWRLRDLATADHQIAAWRRGLLDAYAPGSVERTMGVLVTLLNDAVDQGIIHRNPAAAKRRRGRVAPKRQQRQQGRYDSIVDPHQAWTIAERCAVLSGRDDEFVLVMALYWFGLRWGEAIGMERGFVNTSFTLENQLQEFPGRRFYWKGAKSGSVRQVDVPPFMASLLRHQAEQVQHSDTEEAWCPCGNGAPDKYRHTPGLHMFTGYKGDPHWRSNTWRYQFFYPAARGAYYPDTKQEMPVYFTDADDPFSIVETGRGRRRPTEPAGQWEPVRQGMTVHGLRHSHRALLEDLGTPKVLMDDRMGHSDPSISARYAHVTSAMRQRMMDALQERWAQVLEQRKATGVESPVGLVRALLGQDEGSHSRSAPDLGSRLQISKRGRVA